MKDFSLTVLGGGTAAMDKKRNPAGFWVKVGDKNIMLDCGYGIVRRMMDYGFDYQDVEVMAISHFHADHFADAFPLIFARFVDDSYRGQTETRPLTLMGPKGMEKAYRNWRKIYWPGEEEYRLTFVEEENYKPGEVEIESFEVKHIPNLCSRGYVVKYGGKKIVYTGDIGSDHNMDDLVERVKGSDLLITEASYAERTAGHFTFEQVEELRKRSGVKKVLVVHISPTQVERIEKRCRMEKDLILAVDGMKIEIE